MKHLTQYLERYDIKHLKFCQKYSALSHIFSYLPRCLILGLNTVSFDINISLWWRCDSECWAWWINVNLDWWPKGHRFHSCCSLRGMRKHGRGGWGRKAQKLGKDKGALSPQSPSFFSLMQAIPPFFFLPPYSLPLSATATQATPVARARICFFFSRLCHWLNEKLISYKNFYM